jgi:hypothetical protein
MENQKTKKITDEIKQQLAFLFAKEKQLTSREASRFASLFKSDEDFKYTCESPLSVIQTYLRAAREPNLRRSHDLTQLTTRSKVVTAYELQRKAFVQIVTIRHKDSDAVDEIVSQFRGAMESDYTYRQQLVQHILRNIN